MKDDIDIIKIELPYKAEYVSVARLTASAICTRAGFDVEDIEDIKVAMSEVCSKLVQMGSEISKTYSISFNISQDDLNIVFHSEDKGLRCMFKENSDKFVIAIISALMDNVDFCSQEEYIFSMSKAIKGNA